MATLAQLHDLIDTIGTGEKNTAEEMRIILNAFSTSVFLTGDIKEVDCTTAYVLANFDATGLGINERVGWAICNGLNGTKDRVGRVSIGYGDTYPTIGFTGGAKEEMINKNQLPAIDVPFTGSNDDTGDPGDFLITSPGNSNGARKLTTVAGTQAFDKMQPFIVTLIIQKL